MPDKPHKNAPGVGMQVVETPDELEQDGLRRLRIDIRRALPNRRLDKYLAGRLGELSRTALQQYIREGAVTVNRQIVKPSYTIRTGDVIEMLLPEPEQFVIEPEPIRLDVIYEDDDIIAVNKQAGLIVHPARGNHAGTLLNALAYYFQQKGADSTRFDEIPDGGDRCRPGIVHRLDRDTSGVILLAKTRLALWRLGRQFELRRIHKTYRAIVHGQVEVDEDIIDAPIGVHHHHRERYAVHRQTEKETPPSAKSASTRYRVLHRLTDTGAIAGGFTYLELYPKTGRTHQLRVHMSYIGHPIVGDRTYGGGPVYQSQLDGKADTAYGPIITRQALHAAVIEFQHPRTLKTMRIEAPLPEDFLSALRALGGGKGSTGVSPVQNGL
ncbi:MAG: RluA family pseudouridine synthase [Planctomycetota bacterium]|nr:RluA family pseudouridine synthase [Planctomycetota bacterium]